MLAEEMNEMTGATEEETLMMSVEQAEVLKKRGETLDRLFNNADFQEVIENEYFKEEAVRFVMLKADPNCQTEDWKRIIENGLIGISQLRFYLDMQRGMARNAEDSLLAAEQELEEARLEASSN